MRRLNQPVETQHLRGHSGNNCGYCAQPLGEQHTAECVCRERSIVIEATLEVVVSVPDAWTQEDIEFHYGESSWCASNIVAELARQEGKAECLCDRSSFAYLREATEEDDKLL